MGSARALGRQAPPVIRRGLCFQDQLITMPQTPILRRELATDKVPSGPEMLPHEVAFPTS
jgi:hypothetical protein